MYMYMYMYKLKVAGLLNSLNTNTFNSVMRVSSFFSL